jgi:hypothetical protein
MRLGFSSLRLSIRPAFADLGFPGGKKKRQIKARRGGPRPRPSNGGQTPKSAFAKHGMAKLFEGPFSPG